MASATLAKSAAVSAPNCGETSTSDLPSVARLRCTFCSARMLIICAVMPTTELKVSRPARGVPMFTAITTSTPIARATSTGTLLTRPPSPSRRSSTSVGGKTPGTLIDARSANAKSPCERTTAAPVSRSVATARNGIGRRLKSCTSRTGNVKRRSRFSRPRLDTAPAGTRNSPSRMPSSIRGEISKSSSLRRCDKCWRSTRAAKTLAHSTFSSSCSSSVALIPLA